MKDRPMDRCSNAQTDGQMGMSNIQADGCLDVQKTDGLPWQKLYVSLPILGDMIITAWFDQSWLP